MRPSKRNPGPIAWRVSPATESSAPG
jgi:hypothetical protein